jgi:beta-galactosidase
MPVTVPHGWNIGDGADGLEVPKEKRGHRSVSSPSYERKKVCYARALPDPVKGTRTFVKCEGASVKAEMRVNGKEAGRHAGAYTAFCFE